MFKFLFILPLLSYVFCAPCVAEHHASEHPWLLNADADPQVPPLPHPVVHFLHDFPFPQTTQDEDTARPILHEHAGQMNPHDSLVLVRAYIDHENVLSLFSSSFITHLENVTTPYFQLNNLSILATTNLQQVFVIVMLARTSMDF